MYINKISMYQIIDFASKKVDVHKHMMIRHVISRTTFYPARYKLHWFQFPLLITKVTWYHPSIHIFAVCGDGTIAEDPSNLRFKFIVFIWSATLRDDDNQERRPREVYGRGQRSCKCNYVDFYKDARPPCWHSLGCGWLAGLAKAVVGLF